jgi:O-antigen/teichoic acid export membrane protein
MMLAIPAQFGLPRLIVRETAKAHVNSRWGRMYGLWRWATYSVALTSLLVAVMAALIIWILLDSDHDIKITTLLIGLMLLPVASLVSLHEGKLLGLRRVILGYFPDQIIRPLVFIILLLAVGVFGVFELDAAVAMSIHVVAALVSLLAATWIVYRFRPAHLRSPQIPEYDVGAWLASSWPLTLTAGMQQINKNTDIIMLGFFVPADEIGVYKVAVQGGFVVIFGLQAIGMIISPYFARLHAQEDHERLHRLFKIGARVSFLTALPIVLIFAFIGEDILRIVFGDSYVGAYVPLMILSLGQLVNSMIGHVGILLNMTGNERDTMRGMVFAALANVVLNALLIPFYGVAGAALATALTLIIWNIFLSVSVKQKLKIDTFELFKFR